MQNNLDERSLALRSRIIETLAAARRGHVASALSLVEILRVLFDDVLKYDARRPDWPARDRLILSKGHGCLALYVLLAEKGFFPEEELLRFCRSEGLLGGHPDRRAPGVEAATGSLGHGLSIGLGMALNARLEKRQTHTFVVLGDGECNEGAVWEAALCAGKHGLENLTAIIDYNKMQSYGAARLVQSLSPFGDKWRSFGFAPVEVDGHDVSALRTVLQDLPCAPGRPTAVICHTVKGKGIPFAENNASWHHKSRISDEEIVSLYEAVKS